MSDLLYYATSTLQVFVKPLDEDGAEGVPLSLYREVRAHSTEFSWGYGGSGPSQLALALACHVTGDRTRAQRVYMRLKWAWVAQLEQGKPWQIRASELLALIEREEANGNLPAADDQANDDPF